MRRLVLVLLTANILTFGIGFESRMRASLVSQVPEPRGDDATVVALGEPTEIEGPTALRPEARPRLCARLGPFTNAKAAEALGSLMAPGAVLAVGRQDESGEASTRYWIHLPPADAETAATTLARLESAGLADILWLKSGPHAGAISLGLYSSTRTRDKRLAELRAAGIEPHVEARQAQTTEYWAHLGFTDLDSRLAADVWLAERQRETDSVSVLTLMPESCPSERPL